MAPRYVEKILEFAQREKSAKKYFMKPTTVVILAQRAVASADVRFGNNKNKRNSAEFRRGTLLSTGATVCTVHCTVTRLSPLLIFC